MENNDVLKNGYQTVNNIFKEKTIFFIPRFQRGYRWTKDNVEKLIDDIFEEKWLDDDFFKKERLIFDKKIHEKINKIFYIEDDITAVSPYCIQPLAICEDEIKRGDTTETVFSVIDGQQRLTTLLIVISALKSFSKNGEGWPSIAIEYESRMDSALYLKKLFEFNAEKEYVEMQREKSLDFQYMYNSFCVAQAMFKSRLEHIDQEEYREQYIEYLKNIILYNTRFIWYKFDRQESDPHTIFDNFNTGKTSLTDSELIKAIFMDGDNYDSEDIDDKRIVISEKWDEIENELHDEEFWTFVPHAGQYNTESNVFDTRIDLIFEYLVYRKWKEIRNKDEEKYNTYIEAKRGSSQDHYLYELVNRWIENTLDTEVKDNITKAQVMGKCWAEVRNIYLELRELYKEDLISGNENQIYNMVGLYIKLRNIRTSTLDHGVDKYGNIDEDEQEDIAFEIYDVLVRKVINVLRSERKNNLKDLIYEELGYDSYYKEDSTEVDRGKKIEYAIKKINYDDDEQDRNRPAIKTLLAYNIALITQSSGLGERFNFRALAKQTWQKEHIFACDMQEDETDESRFERRRKALETLSKENNDYINYVKYITGYKTKKDNPDDSDKRVWTYNVKNIDEETEKIILDEDDENSVKGYLNSVDLNFNHRDERDTKTANYRMAKALKLRGIAKEKLEEIIAIVKIENAAKISCDIDEGKMRLYLALVEVQNRFDKKTCFNNSELQKELKKEIERCVSSNKSQSDIIVRYNNIETKYQRTDDSGESIVENIERNWFKNYKDSIYKKYFTQENMANEYFLKSFGEIASEDWSNLQEILITMKESMKSDVERFFEKDLKKYLKDNSLGNMALLTAGTKSTVENQAGKSKTDMENNQNSKVGASPFYQKKVEIINFSKNGKFVPIGTVMVFSGAFEEDTGSQDYWLHSCRRKYLLNMIDTLKKFLGKDSSEETE